MDLISSFILIFILLFIYSLSLVQPFWGVRQVVTHLFIYPFISHLFYYGDPFCSLISHKNLIVKYCSLWCQLLQKFFYLILVRSMGSGRTRPVQIAKIIYNLQKLKTNFSQMLFSMMLVITGRARAESQTWSIFLINQTILR